MLEVGHHVLEVGQHDVEVGQRELHWPVFTDSETIILITLNGEKANIGVTLFVIFHPHILYLSIYIQEEKQWNTKNKSNLLHAYLPWP